MSDTPDRPPAQTDADLERAVRAERKFSLAEAIGRMAGPGAMKGASPVTALVQAAAVIENHLRDHLTDSGGVLRGIVLRHVADGEDLPADYDRPLAALAGYVRQALGSEYRLTDLVREADAEWGRVMGERPRFETPGRPSDPDDPYTAASVRAALTGLLGTIADQNQ
jgi:hypothetical protein